MYAMDVGLIYESLVAMHLFTSHSLPAFHLLRKTSQGPHTADWL